MKSVTIAEFKRNLPALLGEVAKGDRIIIQKGRSRENVAILAPFTKPPQKPRKLGVLAKRGKPAFKKWEMTEDEFLGSR
jgi:antitoxin (DNA-binding transcriptional repressor) of toxin-antitoxin stability system